MLNVKLLMDGETLFVPKAVLSICVMSFYLGSLYGYTGVYFPEGLEVFNNGAKD